MMKEAAQQPRAEAPPPNLPPHLDTCIDSIITLAGGDALSTKDAAALACSMMGVCVHIARDQDQLAKVLRSDKELPDNELPEMPATRELLTGNPELFRCMLAVLSPSTNTGGAQNANQVFPPGSSEYQQKHGRKRSPSEDASQAANRKKLLLSPTPMGVSQPKQGHALHPSKTGTEKSIPALAATILYTLFQHIDCWPVQIMKAFAEDSFGPRNWVDDERCKALVSNLEVSLKPGQGFHLDSGSEEVEAHWVSMMKRVPSSMKAKKSLSPSKASSLKEQRKQAKVDDDDDSPSSSSGEEEVLESESLPSQKEHENAAAEDNSGMSTVSSSLSLQHNSSANSSLFHNMFQPTSIATKAHIRPRYSDQSLGLAYEAITDALRDRLSSKSKNYGLLQVLPTFLVIPQVRCLVVSQSSFLERWLQSPALAGLARVVFARIVQEMQRAEPPLPEDLEVIKNVLKLNLKANQLAMHIDHVTNIASKMRTPNVAELIFAHCIQGERASGVSSNSIKPNDDHLRMLRSAYAVLDRKLAANALAQSVLSCSSEMLDPSSRSDEQSTQLRSISSLLCTVVDVLGELFDGYHFVKAIIKSQSRIPKTVVSVNTSASLIFECCLLVTRTIPSFEATSKAIKAHSSFAANGDDFDSFRKTMIGLRKAILKWCLTSLCQVYYNRVTQEEQAKCADAYYERGAVIRGPGAPSYDSALDVNLSPPDGDRSSSFQKMMSVLRCLLFLSPPSSQEMKRFTGNELEGDRLQRVGFCCQYGVDVDDAMLQMILRGAKERMVTPNTALSIIEVMLLRCGSGSVAKIDCTYPTVDHMYVLAEYVPEFRSGVGGDSDSFTTTERKDENGQASMARSKLPRLAVTSLWWRVSSIALVLSGVLPEKVGAQVWEENPTLRALIRMTTAQKYRFPTADCDEKERQRVRQAEESVRQQEAAIAELLFLPPEQSRQPAKPKPQIMSPTHHRQGLRFSARQRERKEKLIAIEEERQAALALADELKLRKLLKTLQKNIMLWDPRQDQRKPPKGSIDLLLSVNGCFELAEKFRLSTSPDFLLRTIAGDDRSAIERAYSWLIPIISSRPAIINRLHPSASCFLLLRGEADRSTAELATPLLFHVRKCLRGEFGEHQCKNAMELLLQDVADENDDRRRCARRVLQSTCGDEVMNEPSHSWASQMVSATNSKLLVPLATKYLSRALAYERGKVLSVYISALSEFKLFLTNNSVDDAEDWSFDFVATICQLIFARPRVCGDAFDRFPHLRALAVDEIKNAFEKAIRSTPDGAQRWSDSSAVVVAIPKLNGGGENGSVTSFTLPSTLFHAAIILISNWQRLDCENDEGVTQNSDEEASMCRLLEYLVIPFSSGESGLSSAKSKDNGARAVSVEEWILVAKARAEKVARHAAACAPYIYLPRLLLCCGMPKPSFYTMLRRLGHMGDSSSDSAKLFEELLSPSAVSQWGLPGIGSRRSIKRKLYGRIMAYTRIHATSTEGESEQLSVANNSFVSWLSAETSRYDGMKKTQTKDQASIAIVSDMISSIPRDPMLAESGECEDLMEEEHEDQDGALTPDFIHSCVDGDQYNVLEDMLGMITAKSVISKNSEQKIGAAKILLESSASFRDDPSFIRILLKWVPLLGQDEGDEHLWQLIFLDHLKLSKNRCQPMHLVCGCALHWADEHISACQAWILSQQADSSLWESIHSLELVLRFFVLASEQRSIDCFQVDSNSGFHAQEGATSLVNLALHYARVKDNSTTLNHSRGMKQLAEIDDWMTLVVLIGRSHQALVVKHILEEKDKSPASTYDLLAALMRLYLMFPLSMSLSDPKLRNALLQASEQVSWWHDWRCPLDDQITDMLSNLTKSPHQRLVQSVSDIAKQHPLLFVRHLKFLSYKLLEDGTGRDNNQQRLMKRGRSFGKNPLGDPAVAQIGDRIMRVTIVQWGFSFNEPVWSSVIDLLLALPVEVVYSSASCAKMGLLDILSAYLRLFSVQTVDLQSEGNIVALREKFKMLLQSFEKCNTSQFRDWTLREDGRIQHLLLLTGVIV